MACVDQDCVIAAVVVNVLLGLLIFYLVKWEKYLTRTQEVRCTALSSCGIDW